MPSGDEVYVSPAGGSSVVVLEEDQNPDNDRPAPRRGGPPPPDFARRRPSGRRREEGEVDMLPEEDLMQFVDLGELANPDKMAKADSPRQQGPPADDGRKDKPVPPKFPPAPTRRKKRTPRRPPTPPPPASAWDEGFEAHEEQREVFTFAPPPEEERYFDETPAPPPPRVERAGERRRRRSDEPRKPREPQVSPEEVRQRRAENEKVEKMQLLYKLYEFEQRGHRMANTYSMDSNVDELRFEVAKIRNIESAKHSVKWYKVFLMIVVSTIETLNTKFDPFGLRLKGWSKEMNSKKEDLDDCFHRLHDKYSSKAAIEPELELAFALFGGAFMYHLENAADNYGEMGTLVRAIAGGGPAKPAPPPPQSSSGMMTNMPSFQPPPPAAAAPPPPPATDKGGRRVMRPPPIPSGAADVASMMPLGEPPAGRPMPATFEPPPSVGGIKRKPRKPPTPKNDGHTIAL